MVKNHLKRHHAPQSWPLQRKSRVFIVRPKPGQSGLTLGMPLGMILRDVLHLASNAKEVRYILQQSDVLIDGRRRKDPHTIVGFMDTLSIPSGKLHYRVTLTRKGTLICIPISEQETQRKVCKIIGKTLVGKHTQLNLYDAKNILVQKGAYAVNDSLLLELPKNTIHEHLPFTPGAMIMLISGQHKGDLGTIERFEGQRLFYTSQDGTVYETQKKCAFVIGTKKPAITAVHTP